VYLAQIKMKHVAHVKEEGHATIIADGGNGLLYQETALAQHQAKNNVLVHL